MDTDAPAGSSETTFEPVLSPTAQLVVLIASLVAGFAAGGSYLGAVRPHSPGAGKPAPHWEAADLTNAYVMSIGLLLLFTGVGLLWLEATRVATVKTKPAEGLAEALDESVVEAASKLVVAVTDAITKLTAGRLTLVVGLALIALNVYMTNRS